MRNAYISGTGFYVPDDVVTNDDLVARYGVDTTDEWIRKRTGIEARRFAPEGMGPSDLAAPAVEMALERAGLAQKNPGGNFWGRGGILWQIRVADLCGGARVIWRIHVAGPVWRILVASAHVADSCGVFLLLPPALWAWVV